tara:strand:+ start:1686 stop:2828 length:1143 start_codon:yes stop_codon:yes gene_type:complete
MNKKICLLTYNINIIGGANRRVLSLYKVLSKIYNVDIVSMRSYIDTSEKNLSLISKISRCQRLRKKLKNYNLIIAFSLLPSLLSLLNDTAHIFVSTGSSYYAKGTKFISRIIWTFILQPTIYCFTDAIVPASPHLVPDIFKLLPIRKKIYYINGLIDIDRLTTDYFSNKLNQRELLKLPFICFSSAITEHKGILDFIDVYAKYLKEAGTSALNLLVIGSGPDLAKCYKKCESLNITYSIKDFRNHKDCKVYFLGKNLNPIAILSKAYLFVMPTYYEGLSNQILEALFCNIPIYATNCKGNVELFKMIKSPSLKAEDKLTLLPLIKDDKSKQIWANKIIRITKENRNQNKEPSAELVKPFSVEVNSKKWLEIIKNVINDSL